MKVTYILGAGASANALPTIQPIGMRPGLADSLIGTANALNENNSISDEHKDFKDKLVGNLYEIGKSSKQFGTTDTFAKFLYLKERDNDLNDLKEALVAFFVIKQCLDFGIDERPLIFLTTVMQRKLRFPENIRIINWNLDFQIQLASHAFTRESFEMTAGAIMQSDPLIPYYPCLGHDLETSGYSMVHMNGIAGFYQYDDVTFMNYFTNAPEDYNDLFKRLKANKKNLLTFGWETSSRINSLIKERISHAKKMVEGTDILVVIGYSFPFFNREIDKEIFSSIKQSSQLKKIYFQDPNRNGQFLKNQFGLDSIEIDHVEDVSNYFVPPEL